MSKEDTTDTKPADSTPPAEAPDTKPAAEETDPFAAALDNAENEPAEGAAAPGDDGFGFEEGTFNEDAQRLLAKLCETHKLDKRSMAPFLKDLVGQSRDLEEQQAQQLEQSRRAELRQMWGKDYNQRVNKVAGFIRQVGKSVGWSEEQIHSLGTAEGFRLFGDIMRYVGESGTRGKNAEAAPANNYAGWDKNKLETERARLAREVWLADGKEQEELRERHAQVVSALRGTKVEPFLPLKPRRGKK